MREIDIDAERIKNLALKLERQSFAYQQMVVFGAPAGSRWILLRDEAAVIKKGAAKRAYMRVENGVKQIQQTSEVS